MIRQFRDARAKVLFGGEIPAGLPPGILRKAQLLLAQLHAATLLSDMSSPPGNRLHRLKGARSEQHAVWINEKWRLVFKWAKEGTTEVEITDYHDDKF